MSVRHAFPWHAIPRISERWIGALLLTQFVCVCAVKSAQDACEEVAWLSHIALLLASCGFLLRRRLLIATALTVVLVPHAVWLCDFFGWLLAGRFPLNICGYLADADVWTWLATLHHFYLLPLLLTWFCRHRDFPPAALPLAIAVFLYAALFSRAALPPGSNVNYAFAVDVVLTQGLGEWLNRLPAHAYLVALNLAMSGLAFLPASLLLRCCSRSHTS